jgi:methyl-accepting chemotaxis protein
VNDVASAIAAAVEEQGAATREIAASVQTVARQNEAATRAMREVSGVAGDAGAAGRSVLDAAGEVARVAEDLRGEVDHFLAAMRGDEDERRRWERVSGHGTAATLRARGRGEARATLRDISRGGAALTGGGAGLDLPPGTEVELDLPGAGGGVPARVARMEAGPGGVLALAFRQDPATLARVDAAIAALKPAPTRLAA